MAATYFPVSNTATFTAAADELTFPDGPKKIKQLIWSKFTAAADNLTLRFGGAGGEVFLDINAGSTSGHIRIPLSKWVPYKNSLREVASIYVAAMDHGQLQIQFED